MFKHVLMKYARVTCRPYKLRGESKCGEDIHDATFKANEGKGGLVSLFDLKYLTFLDPPMLHSFVQTFFGVLELCAFNQIR